MVTIYARRKNLQYFELSAKTNYNFEKPFLWLARRLTNQPELQFKGNFAKAPEIEMTEEQKAQLKKDEEEAANAVIGDDTDL